MAKYFRYFPKTPYLLDTKGELNLITNIVTRVKFLEEIKNTISSYYKYDISNDDTPENLAYKFYGSTEKHWIILLLNDIIDPKFDWYMNYEILNKFIEKKYYPLALENNFTSGLEFSQNNDDSLIANKKYYIREKRYIVGNSNVFSRDIETDAITWQNFSDSGTSKILSNSNNSELVINFSKIRKNFYEIENENNEKKRTIRILKKEYVARVEEELKSLLALR